MENYKLTPLLMSRKLNFFKGPEEILASIQIPILEWLEAKISSDLGCVHPNNSEIALCAVHLNNWRNCERI